MMETQEPLIHRAGIFILAFQMEGLCAAIRHALSCQVAPGVATLALLRRSMDAFRRISTGPHLDVFPEIAESLSPADILAIAETLRMNVSSFLSPEQSEEKTKMIGFKSE